MNADRQALRNEVAGIVKGGGVVSFEGREARLRAGMLHGEDHSSFRGHLRILLVRTVILQDQELMKIKGSAEQNELTTEVTLPRPGGENLRLRIQPLPLGFQRRLQEHGVEMPLPPRRVARDSTGKPLRDERGEAVFYQDEQDRGYRLALDLFHQRVAVLIVAESLRGEPDVEFEAKPPMGSNSDWCDYADRLYQELEAARFRAGDLLYLCQEIGKLSNLFDQHVEQSERRFFSDGGTPMTT